MWDGEPQGSKVQLLVRPIAKHDAKAFLYRSCNTKTFAPETIHSRNHEYRYCKCDRFTYRLIYCLSRSVILAKEILELHSYDSKTSLCSIGLPMKKSPANSAYRENGNVKEKITSIDEQLRFEMPR